MAITVRHPGNAAKSSIGSFQFQRRLVSHKRLYDLCKEFQLLFFKVKVDGCWEKDNSFYRKVWLPRFGFQ